MSRSHAPHRTPSPSPRLPDNFSAGLLLGNAVPFPIAPPGVPGITPSPFHLPMGPHSMPLSMPMAMPLAMHADPAGGNAANPSGPGSEAGEETRADADG